MQIKVTTRMRLKEEGVVVDMILLPRGSGNRNAARRLRESFERNEQLRPHLLRVVSGTSRVTLHLKASVELMRVISEMRTAAEQARDVPGQLKLFQVEKVSVS